MQFLVKSAFIINQLEFDCIYKLNSPNVIENMSKILMAVMLLLSLHTFAETEVSMDLMEGCQNHKEWKTLDYEYYTFEVPSEWVLRFGHEDKVSIHRRNIRFPNDKGEEVEYELGTLSWGTEVRNMEEFMKIVDVEIRSFRKTSGAATFLSEVKGKIPEACWPEYMEVISKEEGGTNGKLWKTYLLKGESDGYSVVGGAFKMVIWAYKFYTEKNGMVYCLTVSMPDNVRSSSVSEYDKMARRIIQNFKVK